MSKKVRGRVVGGDELGGGETLQSSRTLVMEDFSMERWMCLAYKTKVLMEFHVR